MAQALNSKLTASGTVDDAEATLIRSSLVQLGLPAPALTPDMVRDEQKYSEGLAKELGQLLTGQGTGRDGLMVGKEGRGVIGLDEVWGLWMRARGVGKSLTISSKRSRLAEPSSLVTSFDAHGDIAIPS